MPFSFFPRLFNLLRGGMVYYLSPASQFLIDHFLLQLSIPDELPVHLEVVSGPRYNLRSLY